MHSEGWSETSHCSEGDFRIDWMTLAFWGTVGLACVLRFYDLAAMPLHHDESLYGVYCFRFFKGQGYMYDPVMHGPFMFHFQALIFFLFGVGDFSVRIAPAFLGCLLIASTSYLKEFVGKTGVLLIAVLLTFSPTHLYFSRFMRHDSYIAFFTYISVAFGLLYWRRRRKTYLYLTAAALSLMFCVKENAYIHAFIFLTFWVIKEIAQTYLFRFPEYRGRLKERLQRFVSEQRYPLIFAGFIFVWIYLVLYTTFFTHPAGFLDGLYRKSLTYWWNQHSIQRIKGPFHYYAPFFFLYELPVFLLALGGLLWRIARTLNARIVAAWATTFSGVLLVLYGHIPLPLWFEVGHMERLTDLLLALYTLFIGAWGTLYFLKSRQTLLAFFTYWSSSGFFIYSYAGEKVPWLFLHIILPMTVLAGLLLRDLLSSDWWRRPGLAATVFRYAAGLIGLVFLLYTVHTTVLLNYYNRANPAERMVYTQTSTDILDMLELVQNVKFGLNAQERDKPIIAVQGNAVWPMAWYLRDYEGWYYPGDLTQIRRPLVIVDWEKREETQEILGPDYQEIRVKLREWWIPDASGSIADWWRYFLYRKAFNPTGSSDIAFYVRQG